MNWRKAESEGSCVTGRLDDRQSKVSLPHGVRCGILSAFFDCSWGLLRFFQVPRLARLCGNDQGLVRHVLIEPRAAVDHARLCQDFYYLRRNNHLQ